MTFLPHNHISCKCKHILREGDFIKTKPKKLLFFFARLATLLLNSKQWEIVLLLSVGNAFDPKSSLPKRRPHVALLKFFLGDNRWKK